MTEGILKWHVCCLKLICHSNSLIKATLLGVLTCILTIGKMPFIIELNSVKSQSTVDLPKGETVNLRNHKGARTLYQTPVKNLAFTLVIFHSLKPPPDFSLLGIWFASYWQFLFSLWPPLTSAQDAALLICYYPYKQGVTMSPAHPDFLQVLHWAPTAAIHNPQPILQLDLLHSPTPLFLRRFLWCPSFP